MIVKPQHWPHLKQQHGRIGVFKDDYREWVYQYGLSIDSIYDNIRGYLPEKMNSVLDIGGGFSGISTKLPGIFSLTVIDGLEDEAKRGGTTNNELLAREFLGLNGVFDVNYISPENAQNMVGKFDLIYSFASYPFHVKPEVYAKNLIRNSHEDTVFIFEVRKGWEIPLDIVEVIYEEEKYERVVAKRPR